jgi:hypothetical protein
MQHLPCAGKCGQTVAVAADDAHRWDHARITCGSRSCWARATYTAEQWAGARRMAEARQAIDLELSPLDLLALTARR